MGNGEILLKPSIKDKTLSLWLTGVWKTIVNGSVNFKLGFIGEQWGCHLSTVSVLKQISKRKNLPVLFYQWTLLTKKCLV